MILTAVPSLQPIFYLYIFTYILHVFATMCMWRIVENLQFVFAPGIELGVLGLAQVPYSESPAGPKKHF